MSAKPPTRSNAYAPGTQLVRDKTNHGMPPSPTYPSPGLMSPSNSASNSSGSPPEPFTPPRTNRSRSRYPDIGRVPLHRRGTSKTYERLEDLLKEAGYKETRVFTPETERSDAGEGRRGTAGNQDTRLSVRDGMDAVVGFLTGLLPSAMTSKTCLEQPPEPGSTGPTHLTTSAPDYSPPISPVAIRALQGQVAQQMQKRSSRSSLHHQAIQHHSNIVSPRPSRAGTYIRHVPSVSSMPPRPNSTPAHMSKPVIFLNDGDIGSTHTLPENSDQPPLPPSWLESVARAVLSSGTGTYIGGPSKSMSHESPTNRSARPPVLRATRSSLSQVSSGRSKYHRQSVNRRSGLSDQTNTPTTPTSTRSAFLIPPPLFSQIERGRSGRSEGQVSKTRVVCRSAPGSRNGSLTRDDGMKKRKKEEKGRLPSLARTKAEGDVWTREAHIRYNTNRYLSGWGADADSEGGLNSSSEEEEDGELDLARILVPPKRQNSIKSLRKHLACEVGPGPTAHASLKNYAARPAGSIGTRAGREMSVSNGEDGNGRKPTQAPSMLQRRTTEDWDGESQEEWGGGWVRKGAGNRESEDDDVDSFVGFFGEGRTSLAGTSKNGNRLSAWGLMGSNGS